MTKKFIRYINAAEKSALDMSIDRCDRLIRASFSNSLNFASTLLLPDECILPSYDRLYCQRFFFPY